MNKGFWSELKKPIVGLAPMDGVTDAAWRYIAKKYGQADVIYTEFVSVEGLWRIKKRNQLDHKIWTELKYDESERPVVVQLFGSDPQSFYEATKIVCDMGFDGIDINMGCPSPGLEKSGGGAGLMRNPDLAARVIDATRRAVADSGLKIPVSVKTRIGSSKPDVEWWKYLASEGLPLIAMHGRTFKQLYSGEADWEILAEAAEIIKKSGTKFLGNGDIKNLRVDGDALSVELNSGLKMEQGICFDGVLIGRQAMGNPWILRKDGLVPTTAERMKVALEHSHKFEEIMGAGKAFFAMRKHLAWYAHGFPDSGILRKKLVLTNSAYEVGNAIEDFFG